jgi:hypothetical protein
MKTPPPEAAARERAELLQQMQQKMREQTTREVLKSGAITAADRSSLGIGERPLELVYRAAMQKLNEMLQAEFGPNAIETAAASEVAFTPEATAGRIVSLSTGFYAAFKAHHPNEDEASVLQHFMEVIRSGIEQGFAEARDILDGLGVLEGKIKEDVDRTYELVQAGLQRFEQEAVTQAPPGAGDTPR